MNALLDRIKNKTVLDWVALCAAVCAVVVAVLGAVNKGLSWEKWDYAITVFLCLGAAAEIAGTFVRFDFKPLIPLLFYLVGLIFVINGAALVLIDYVRQINWVGGDPQLCLAYVILTLVPCAVSLIRCFTTDKKAV